jgi:hypothetical protein
MLHPMFGKSWFIELCACGTLATWFAKKWRPGEVELLER